MFFERCRRMQAHPNRGQEDRMEGYTGRQIYALVIL